MEKISTTIANNMVYIYLAIGALVVAASAGIAFFIWWWYDVKERADLPGTVYLGWLDEDSDKTRKKSKHTPPGKLWLTKKARQQHTWIKGNTRTGKSTLMANMMMQDMEKDIPIIYFDFKSDTDGIMPIIKKAIELDQEDKICYTSINMGEMQQYSMYCNPFADIFESDAVNDPDPLMQMLGGCIKEYLGESLYHRQEAEQLVERFIYAAAYSGRKVNMRDIEIGVSNKRVRDEAMQMCSTYLEKQSAQHKRAVSEAKSMFSLEDELPEAGSDDWYDKTHRVASHINSLNRGDLGEHLSTYVSEVNAADVIDNNKVWLIQIPVTDDPQKSVFFYNMILHSLHRKVSQLKKTSSEQSVGVYIDDFPFAMTGTLVQHLRQSGGSGVMIHISNQEEKPEELPGVENTQAQAQEFYDLCGNRIVFNTSSDQIIQEMSNYDIKIEYQETSTRKQDGEKTTTTTTETDKLIKSHTFKNTKGVAVCDVKLEDDYPYRSYQARGFPAVGTYKMQHPNIIQNLDSDDQEEARELLEERKKEAEDRRSVKEQQVRTMSLEDKIQKEEDSLWGR